MPMRLLQLEKWLAPLGGKLPTLYLVGGSVRDICLGRPFKDLDLVSREAADFAVTLAQTRDAALVPLLKHPQQPCFRVVDRNDPKVFLDIVPLRGETIQTDLALRDFTINAMAVAVGAGGHLGPLEDPFGGSADLHEGIVRQVTVRSVWEDPLRILRAYRFGAELGFRIEGKTLREIRRASDRLGQVASERVAAELMAILGHPTCTRWLHRMDEDGVLEAVFPEIRHLKGCRQNGYHDKDVWGHTLEVVERCEEILGRTAFFFGSAAQRLTALVQKDDNAALLKLSALLHDVGKPRTRKEHPSTGRVTFYGHDALGAEMARAVCERLRLSANRRQVVACLVAEHRHAQDLLAPHVKGTTRVSWFREHRERAVLCTVLAMADLLAKKGPCASRQEMDVLLSAAGAMVRDYWDNLRERIDSPSLVTGYDIMALGLAPGPFMGKVLRRVREAQDAGQITTRNQALAKVRVLAGFGRAGARKEGAWDK